MWQRSSLLLSTILCTCRVAFGLGTSCTAPLTGGTATPSDPYWLELIEHQGTSPFNPNANSYQVFRNVMDYGATGNGVTDDTAAINLAMSSGNRCGNGTCVSSTVSPALVYFPQGTYLVSSAIDTYYYTQMIGDARNPPTLLASSNFSGFAVIDADPYIPNGGGAQWFVNQDNFFRSVRNLIIDMQQIPMAVSVIGLHWQVSQATSLVNVVVDMSTESGNAQTGLYMESGSGGFMGDIVFNGGKFGIQAGNQQFTVRNITVNNANTAVSGLWDWGFTFQDVNINNCQVGFDLDIGGSTQAGQAIGSEAIIDAVVTDTPIFVQASAASNGTLPYSLVLNNIQLNNVPVAVGVSGGATILEGGTTTIASWAQGNVYSGTSDNGTWTQGDITSFSKPAVLLDSYGAIFGKGHPQYADYSTSQIISVKSQGAKGDGTTDDTEAIQNVFNEYSGCMIIFFDAGVYYVTDTITIPAGTQIVGEAWSVILAGGSNFQDQANPIPVIQAGTAGSQGLMEISDMLFTTAGPAPGAILVEWNVHDPAGEQGAAGLWDTHLRLGGAIGTNMQYSQCPAGSTNTDCQAAFMGIHLTPQSSAYFEGTWVWTADHDLDDQDTSQQTTIFTGRGILSESAGPVWFIGTCTYTDSDIVLASEHNVLYQYNLANAQNHYIGLAQTETPYYQPDPAPPAPYSLNNSYYDPSFPSGLASAWAMYIQSSSDIILFGAGFYSFYQNYGQTCLDYYTCQPYIINIDASSAPSTSIYSLSTIGTTWQLYVGGVGAVNASGDADGFQDTLTAWYN